MDAEFDLYKQMKGKKIIYKKEYLDNHFHGRYSNNPNEAEKIRQNITKEITFHSNFINPYNRIDLAPVKVKTIK